MRYKKEDFLSFIFAGILLFSCNKNPIIPEKDLSEIEARNLIEEILVKNNSRYKSFEKRLLLSLGEKENFYVDYVITKNDSKMAVINYVGENDSQTDFTQQGILSKYNISHLYLKMSSEKDLTLYVNNFISQNFN